MKRMIAIAKKAFLIVKYKYFDEFVFIHINKTGGSSIEKALNIPFNHKTALEIIGDIGLKNWNNRFTFTVIRNPWDKVVSHYHYRVQTNQTNLGNSEIDFREWVKLTYGKQDSYYYNNPKMFMPQVYWISDKEERILVDEIIHFENLSVEFNELLAKMGKNTTLPHLKRSNHRSYREYYDRETHKIVQDWFKRDIEEFGYRF